jgi:hypothetical protein
MQRRCDLDETRIDRQHGGDVRACITNLIVTGGATREQVVAKLKERYGASVSVRSVRAWSNGADQQLVALIRELEQIKASLADDDHRDPADLLKASQTGIRSCSIWASAFRHSRRSCATTRRRSRRK